MYQASRPREAAKGRKEDKKNGSKTLKERQRGENFDYIQSLQSAFTEMANKLKEEKSKHTVTVPSQKVVATMLNRYDTFSQLSGIGSGARCLAQIN